MPTSCANGCPADHFKNMVKCWRSGSARVVHERSDVVADRCRIAASCRLARLQPCNDPAILEAMRLDRDRWRRAAGSLAAAAAGLLSWPPVARASEQLPLPIVAWSAPLECPNAESLVQRLMSLTGSNAARLALAGEVRGQIRRAEGDWVLALEIAAPASTPGDAPVTAPARELRADSCDDLAEAAAVAIAIALGGGPEPEAEAEAPASASAPAAPAAIDLPLPAAAGDTADSDLGESSKRGAPPFGFVAAAEGVLDSASLGGAAFGFAAEAQLRLAELGIGAYAIGLPSYQIPVGAAQYVELSLWAAGLRGCYRASDALLVLDLYAGAELGALGAAGRGLLDASMRRDAWGAATWGAHLGVDLVAHLRVGARLEAVLPLSRPRYLVNQTEVVHEVPSASFRLGVSLASTFGTR